MKRRRKQVLTNHNALLVLFWIWRSTTLETAGSLVVEGKRRSTTTTSRLQRKRKTLISSDQGKKQRGLIIGGEEAVSGDYPYFVHYKKPGCGGSLIAPDIVLTAAHCQQDWVSQYGKLYVGRYERTGGRTTESFSVLSQSVHPMFDGQVCCGKSGDNWFYGVHNDFMLLKLNGQSTTTKPIKLNQSPMRPQQGDELHVIGFGDIDQGQDFVEPDKLHHVTVNYMTNAQCVANSVYTSDLLTLMSMCASDRGEDACSGDSGGPLIAKGATDEDDVLMGVVSWGWDCAVEPGVYARVSAGYSWIREEVCKMSDNPPASFRCPAPPSPPPTSTPTSTPTKSPTLAPTSRPTTPSPTFMPTRSPTTNPTDLPTEEPTVRPTTSHPTPTPTTDAPSRYPSLDPTNTSTSDAPSIISIDTTQQFLQDLQADILWERQQPIVMERTRLSADTQCQDIMDPLVCCAARQTHNDTVCETANVVMDEDGLWTRSPSMTCVSREDNAFRAPGAGVEIEISSHGGVLPSQQQDLLLSKDNTCESILEQHVRRRSTINECSSLISRRSCCSAVDSNGQPCVPILAVAVGDGDQAGGDRCAPMDWIVSNFATARLVECSLRDRQSP